MYTNSIFVFGSNTLCETKQDVLSSLPLEISWKIISYLDDTSLRIAAKAFKTWERIIKADKKLRKRLSMFELGLKLGSHHLARFYKDNKRKMKVLKRQNFIPKPSKVFPVETKVYKLKRGAEELVVHAKRFKLI